MTPDPDFRGTPLFKTLNISETVQDRHTVKMEFTYTLLNDVISYDLE